MIAFAVPPMAHASAPPESRGLARDEVALVVARPDSVLTTRFRTLADHLRPGDLVVVNTSATMPAAVDGWAPGEQPVVVHFSTELDDGSWVVELRLVNGSGPLLDADRGAVIGLAGGATVRLTAARARAGHGVRLWEAEVGVPDAFDGVAELLERVGRPITYAYARGRHSLQSYQPSVARHPGSAEMASAGRPLTPEVLTDLAVRGVAIAPVLLHAGVSSQELGEPPQPERFAVSATTAALVEHTRRTGGRVVAVGTTVTRALESAVSGGRVVARSGWTDRVVSLDDPPVVVNGLITGWHEPTASHLLLLEAVAGSELVEAATAEALVRGLLWHEFGDSCLLLP